VAWDVTEQRRAEDALRESEQRLRHSLEERIRIGRDLHDGIIQSIYAVGLSLGECRRAVEGSHPAAHQKLEHSIGELNRLIREVRDFIEGLEPEALKGREFRTALESIASSLAIPADLELELEIAPDAANGLTAQQAADLLHITREALSNTIRHSGAHHARVALTRALDAAQLTIQDDGCGFDPGRPHSTGLGLRNMESRARDHGGRREVRSAPGQGATLTITLPLRAPEPAP
jgi:signal transduction histidine kinase